MPPRSHSTLSSDSQVALIPPRRSTNSQPRHNTTSLDSILECTTQTTLRTIIPDQDIDLNASFSSNSTNEIEVSIKSFEIESLDVIKEELVKDPADALNDTTDAVTAKSPSAPSQ